MTTEFSFQRRGEPPVECEPLPRADDERRGAPLGLTVHVKVPGSDYAFEGVIEHFFGGEASILLKHRFQKKTPVTVELNGFKFGGEVLYCERKGDVFDTHVLLADQDEAGIRLVALLFAMLKSQTVYDPALRQASAPSANSA